MRRMDSETIENAQPDPECGREPQRGSDLQPRVAASATLGKRFVESQPQGGCADFDSRGNAATALRLNSSFARDPRVVEAANPGL